MSALAIDHVLIVVSDLDSAALDLERDHGLASVAGGRHPGHGTANRIVPLGTSYLELVAVVDDSEAAASPFGGFMQARLAGSGEGPVALCLRTDDIAAVAGRIEDRAFPMTRTRPDGVELSWHLAGLDAALERGLPLFIEWRVSAEEHPGRAAVGHRVAATGVSWVEVGGNAERLNAWIGAAVPGLRAVGGWPGVRRVAIDVADGDPLVL